MALRTTWSHDVLRSYPQATAAHKEWKKTGLLELIESNWPWEKEATRRGELGGRLWKCWSGKQNVFVGKATLSPARAAGVQPGVAGLR
jgi:hypothetical protein